MSYAFGPFRLDEGERQLFRESEVIPLTAKAFDVLLLLVRNAGRTVTKEEFMEAVWAGTVVEESNLSDNISTLRQALGDDAKQPRYIQTVPRRGYKFVANLNAAQPVAATTPEPVRDEIVVAPPRRRPRWIALAFLAILATAGVFATRVWMVRRDRGAADRALSDTHSLAVLPFKPLLATDADAALQVGMTDALIAKLSRIRQLSVRPTMSVLPYAEKTVSVQDIASTLDVDSILDGKLQKSGDRLRVSVQLVRGSDGAILWADRFDERVTDVFALQDTISERVANALQVRLTASDRASLAHRSTQNVEAYQLYLNGMEQWRTFTPDSLLASVNYHKAALKLDPNFAQAWAGLAKAYDVLAIYGPIPANVAYPKAQEAAAKAVALDPNDAETRVPGIAVKLFYERDWAGAQRELDFVEQLDPSNPGLFTLRGYYDQAMGRTDLALAELMKARDVAPQWSVAKNDVLEALVDDRRFDEAMAEAQKGIALDPGPSRQHEVLARALAAKGRYQEALGPAEDYRARTAKVPSRALTTLAWIHGKMGHREKALALIEETKRDTTNPWLPMLLARAYTGVGDYDAAFACLNQAVDQHFAFVWDVRNMFEYDDLRKDPRYAQVLRRIKLEP